ncbi:MAG TPA: thioesterase family protein [Burkholderiales bacterium]|nr:thioesterase family protein [Burkholderiales bacterium]
MTGGTHPAQRSSTATQDPERRLVLTAEIAVRWADQDTNSHVNNATYFTYFEQARILWLRSEQMERLRPDGQGIVVAQASCTYLKPIPYPETLRVPMYTGKLGRSSIPTYYEIFGTETPVKYAEGHVVLVWIDRKSGKSLPLPAALREALTR